MTRTKTRANANMPNNFVSVLDYGAVGDDDTDCTQAFIDAIDAAGVENKTVYVPAGIYRIDPISRNDLTTGNINLIGESRYSSTIKRVGDGSTFSGRFVCEIEHITFTGNGNGTSFYFTEATPLGQQKFTSCLFRNDNYGIKSDALAVAWLFNECWFNGLNTRAMSFDNGTWGCRFDQLYVWFNNVGFYSNGGHGSSISNSVFEYNNGSAVILEGVGPNGNDHTDFRFESIFFEQNCNAEVDGSIIQIFTSAAVRIRNVQFDNCYFTQPQATDSRNYFKILPQASGTIDNIVVNNCTLNQAVNVGSENRITFTNLYRPAGGLSATTRVVKPVTVEQQIVTHTGDNKIAQVSSGFEDPATLGSGIVTSSVGYSCNYNPGSNQFDVVLPNGPSNSSPDTDCATYLLNIAVKDGNVNGASFTYIVTLHGSAGLELTSLQAITFNGNPSLTITRVGDSTIRLNTNNNGRIKSVGGILIGNQ